MPGKLGDEKDYAQDGHVSLRRLAFGGLCHRETAQRVKRQKETDLQSRLSIFSRITNPPPLPFLFSPCGDASSGAHYIPDSSAILSRAGRFRIGE
jgi:hypothetical protein